MDKVKELGLEDDAIFFFIQIMVRIKKVAML